jgi:hypothetical protein
MEKKVRIINTKTGQVRFVSKHIANNGKLLKSYDFVKQDFVEEKKEVKPSDFKAEVVYEPIRFVKEEINEPINSTTEPPKKRGRKPQTIQTI